MKLAQENDILKQKIEQVELQYNKREEFYNAEQLNQGTLLITYRIVTQNRHDQILAGNVYDRAECWYDGELTRAAR